MEKYEFNIGKLFETFFGYVAAPYPVVLATQSVFHPDAKERFISGKGVKYYGRNSLGNWMYMPVVLIRNGAPGLLLENTVIAMSSKKTIVETKLVSQKGSVKEEISIEDWEIAVKGVLVGRNGYPESQVEELKELYEDGSSVGINNVLTSIFLNDEKVIIKSLELGENKGMEHVQPFSMKLVSDTEFDLYLE